MTVVPLLAINIHSGNIQKDLNFLPAFPLFIALSSYV